MSEPLFAFFVVFLIDNVIRIFCRFLFVFCFVFIFPAADRTQIMVGLWAPGFSLSAFFFGGGGGFAGRRSRRRSGCCGTLLDHGSTDKSKNQMRFLTFGTFDTLGCFGSFLIVFESFGPFC